MKIKEAKLIVKKYKKHNKECNKKNEEKDKSFFFPVEWH